MIYYIETHKNSKYSSAIDQLNGSKKFFRAVMKDEFTKMLKTHKALYKTIIEHNDMYLCRNKAFYKRVCVFTNVPYKEDTFEFMCDNSDDWCCKESWLQLAQYQMMMMKDEVLDNIDKQSK